MGGFDGGDFFLEDDTIRAVLAHEADVEPEVTGTIETVCYPEEGREGIVFFDLAVPVVQHMRFMHEVDEGVAEGAGCGGTLLSGLSSAPCRCQVSAGLRDRAGNPR